MPSSYQPNIPTGLIFLDQDYANIQQNFQFLDTYFGVDHTPFSIGTLTNPNGYHKSIHMIPVSTTATNSPNNQPVIRPTATPGFGQIFSAQINDGINIDEALYFLTGGNRLIQLTRNITPKTTNNSNNNGYTYLAGGILFQWGLVNGTHGGDNHFNGGDTADVTFATNNIVFPSKCFAIWTQLYYTDLNNPSSGASEMVNINNNFSPTKFTYFISAASGNSLTSFRWMAIGI